MCTEIFNIQCNVSPIYNTKKPSNPFNMLGVSEGDGIRAIFTAEMRSEFLLSQDR